MKLAKIVSHYTAQSTKIDISAQLTEGELTGDCYVSFEARGNQRIFRGEFNTPDELLQFIELLTSLYNEYDPIYKNHKKEHSDPNDIL